MDVYDFVMIAVLFGAAVFGAMKGLAWQVASVASFVVSYFASLKFSDVVAPHISAEPPWNRIGAMLAIFIVTSLAIWIAFRLVRDFIDRVKLKEFDRQIGFVVGAAKGVLYCVLITFFVVTLWPEGREKVLASKSGLYIAKLIDRADAVMPAEAKEVLGPYLDKLERGLDPHAPPPAPGEGLKIATDSQTVRDAVAPIVRDAAEAIARGTTGEGAAPAREQGRSSFYER